MWGLYWDEAVDFVEIAIEHERNENLLALAIATNPHLEGKHQRSLWDTIKSAGRETRVLKPKTEAEIMEAAKARLTDGV